MLQLLSVNNFHISLEYYFPHEPKVFYFEGRIVIFNLEQFSWEQKNIMLIKKAILLKMLFEKISHLSKQSQFN